jgi:hypothetical protein
MIELRKSKKKKKLGQRSKRNLRRDSSNIWKKYTSSKKRTLLVNMGRYW